MVTGRLQFAFYSPIIEGYWEQPCLEVLTC
jgi:hypothetical protein